MGWWTVTSLVPSGKVASTWISAIISGTPSMTSARVRTERPALMISATLRPSRASSSRCAGDEGDGLGIVQLEAAGASAVRQFAGHVNEQLVSFLGGQMHVAFTLPSHPQGGRYCKKGV